MILNLLRPCPVYLALVQNREPWMTTGAGRTRPDAARVLCDEVSRQGDAALKLDFFQARTGRARKKIHLNGPVCSCLWLVAADRLNWGFWGTCAPGDRLVEFWSSSFQERFGALHIFLWFNFWVGERGQSSQVESSRVTWIYYALTWCPSRGGWRLILAATGGLA